MYDESFQGSDRIYNLITMVMLILTALVVIVVAGMIIARPSGAQPQAAMKPTLYTLPTATETLAGPTVNPTWTITPSPTLTSPSYVPWARYTRRQFFILLAECRNSAFQDLSLRLYRRPDGLLDRISYDTYR